MAETGKPTLFISDLHLDASRPAVTEGFLQFLSGPVADSAALYILGDFFEVWLGDDGIDELARQVMDALAALPAPLYLMHGNRDFLLGQVFCEATGATLLDDPTVIDLYGTPTLLMHGDTLCTRDTAYMQVRQTLRSPVFQADFLAKPLAERAAFAKNARDQSRAHTSETAMNIMDVTPSEVERVMAEAGVRRLIHGHTHRPGRHDLTVNGESAERIVLGDWHNQGWCLSVTGESLDLQTFDL